MVEFLLKRFVKDYKNTNNPTVKKNYGLLGSFFGLITNTILFIGKLVLGILLKTSSVIADAINNLSDFGNNFIAIFGFKISSKKADDDHPFGHQRMEYVTSLIIAMIILCLGMIMIYQGIIDTIEFFKCLNESSHPPIVEINTSFFMSSVVVFSIAIIFKFMQSYLYYSLGKRISNMELKALSKDSINDVISSILVIVGLIITYTTKYSYDCFFSILVGIFVVTSSISILKGSTEILIGQKPDKQLVNSIVKLLLSYEDVISIHDLILHTYGNVIYGVVHVEVDASKNIIDIHEIIDKIEKDVKIKLNVNLTIHMDPILLNDETTNLYLNKIKTILNELDPSLTFHDFRVSNCKDIINISFDLVIPTLKDNDFDKEKIDSFILSKLDDKHVVLHINYDDKVSDFLSESDTKIENR